MPIIVTDNALEALQSLNYPDTAADIELENPPAQQSATPARGFCGGFPA